MDYIQKCPIGTYPLNVTDANRIMTCNWFENPEKFGIPNNIVIKVYNDHNKLQIKENDKSTEPLRIIYIQETECDAELQNLLQIVSIFNQFNSVAPSFYCNEKYAAIFKNYSNEHIQYIPPTKSDGYSVIETNVVITYGPGVLHFMKQQIPVIVVGPYGMGGWVTPENFPYLLKYGFTGRAGSISHEKVPIEIFAHEILCIKKCENLSSILIANKKIADDLPYKPLSAANEIINEDGTLQEKLNDSHTRWKLHPFLASNILFEQNGESVALKRSHIHDTLCTISKEDLPFFQTINGKTNCESLFKDSQMDEDDFWETIYSLNEKKIILF